MSAAWSSASADASSSSAVWFDGFTVDQTERRNAEDTLRKAERLATAGRLAATVAHEVNNPLEAVTNLIYLCQQDRNAPQSVRENLAIAESELSRVAHHHPALVWISVTGPIAPARARAIARWLEALPRSITAVVGGQQRTAITAGTTITEVATMAELHAIAARIAQPPQRAR